MHRMRRPGQPPAEVHHGNWFWPVPATPLALVGRMFVSCALAEAQKAQTASRVADRMARPRGRSAETAEESDRIAGRGRRGKGWGRVRTCHKGLRTQARVAVQSGVQPSRIGDGTT